MSEINADYASISSDYGAWLGDVKSRIQSARSTAARSVSRELILLYWHIGRGIVQKQLFSHRLCKKSGRY